MTKRIVIWGTGFVGKMVIAEVVKHPAFELVGVGVSNPDKVGRDVGELCGFASPLGLTATDDDKLVTYKAVCVDNCPRFQETAEAVTGPDGEYAVWESRY